MFFFFFCNNTIVLAHPLSAHLEHQLFFASKPSHIMETGMTVQGTKERVWTPAC